MRTHRITYKCNSWNCLAWLEDYLHTEFCDLTHWYSGLANEGEDSPDIMIIYRGIMKPTLTVELDLRQCTNDEVSFREMYVDPYNGKQLIQNSDMKYMRNFETEHPDCHEWVVESAVLEENPEHKDEFIKYTDDLRYQGLLDRISEAEYTLRKIMDVHPDLKNTIETSYHYKML